MRSPLGLPGRALCASMLVGAPLLVRLGGPRVPDLLVPEYAPKTWLVIAGALALVGVGAAAAFVRQRAASATARLATLLALLVAAGYAAAALLRRHDPLAIESESIVRIALPLCCAALIASARPFARTVLRSLRWAALALSVLVLLDLAHVCQLLVPLQAQPAATLVHRNNVAFALALALPILVVELLGASRRRLPSALTELLVVAAALAGCRSRTAWIAAAIGCALVSMLRWRATPPALRAPLLLRAQALAATLVLSFVALGSLRPAHGIETVSSRVAHVVKLDDPAMEDRYGIFRDAARLVAARPWLGWGAGNFALRRRAEYALLDRAHPQASWPRPDVSVDAGGHTLLLSSESGAPGVWLVRLDGATPPRRLPAANPLTTDGVLSPDGRSAALHEPVAPLGLSNDHRLSLVDLESGRSERIAETGFDDFVGRAVFAPDGRQVAWERVRHDHDGWHDEIHLFDRDRHADRVLGAHLRRGMRAPSWTADGRALIFGSGRCLERLELADGAVREVGCADGELAARSTLAAFPALSPDGRRVAWTVERERCDEVVVGLLAGGPLRSLAPGDCTTRPSWLPDGRLAAVLTRDGRARVAVWTLGAGAAEPQAWSLSAAQILDLHALPDGSVVALAVDRAMPALWRVRAGFAPERLWSSPPPHRPSVADHPHDDLLGVALEAGVPTALAWVALLALVGIAAARACQRRASDEILALTALLAVFLVLGLTNAPLLLAPSAAVFWLAAAALVVEVEPS